MYYRLVSVPVAILAKRSEKKFFDVLEEKKKRVRMLPKGSDPGAAIRAKADGKREATKGARGDA